MNTVRKFLRYSLYFLGALILLLTLSLYFLRHTVERKIAELVKQQLEPRCECRVEIASVQLQYLPLQLSAAGLTATNLKESSVRINEFFLSLDLPALLERRVVITKVSIGDSEIKGLDEQSVLGRILKNEPQPPPSDKQSSFQVEVVRAEIKNLDLLDRSYGRNSSVKGIAVGADLKAPETYQVSLSANSLQSSGPESPKEVDLGRLEAQALFGKGILQLQSLKLINNTPWVEAKASLAGEKLHGDGTHHIDAAELGLQDFFLGIIHGQVAVSGTKRSPRIEGTAEVSPETGLELISEGQPLLSFERLNLGYEVAFNEHPELSISQFSATGEAAEIRLLEPIVVTREKIAGAIEISTARLALGETRLEGVKASLRLGGNMAKPVLSAEAYSDSVFLNEQSAGKLEVNVSYLEHHASITAKLRPTRGEISAAAELDFRTTPTADSVSIVVKDLPFPLASTPGTEQLMIDTSAAGRGPLNPEGLNIKGQLRIRAASLRSQQLELTGDYALKDGTVLAVLGDGTPMLSAELKAELVGARKSTVEVHLQKVELDKYLAMTSCGRLSAKAQYQFSLEAPRAGSGSISISALEVGCGRQQLTLSQPHSMSVENELLTLGDLRFDTANGNLLLQGTISSASLDVKANGELELEPFSTLVPSVDEIGGKLSFNLTATGLLSAPELQGNLGLESGALLMAAAKVDAENILLQTSFEKNTLTITELSGTLNGGRLSGSGRYSLARPDQAGVKISAKGVEYSPLDGADLLLDVDTELRASGDKPELKAKVLIQEGSFERTIGLDTLVGSLASLFNRDNSLDSVKVEKVAGTLIGLDIDIIAPNQLFLLTNFAQAELAANIHIGGTTSNREIKGSVDLISGNLTLTSRNIELTNGKVRFSPDRPIPNIFLRGETSVVGPSLEEVNIQMSVTGPIDKPKVIFTSDTGLSQQEIISLLTQGQGVGLQSIVDTLSSKVGVDLETNRILKLPGLLGSVTKLDKLSVEPRFNVDTGAVEPSITAAKKLANRLSIQSETTFSRASNRSQLQAIFDLTKRIQLLGTANLPSGSEQQSLGADVAVSIIRPEPNLTLEVTGNRAFQPEQVLDALHLSESSRVLEQQREAIGERVRRFYVEKGYLDAKVETDCEASGTFCKVLRIHIIEGKQSIIRASLIEGELPEELKAKVELLLPKVGDPAEKPELEKAETEIRTLLREADLLRARVRAHYIPAGPAVATAQIEINARQPIRLIFKGNTSYSREELLQLIDFKTRRFPFGRNIALTLTEKIKTHYEAQGYLETSVDRKFERGENGITFILTINEGPRRQVERVQVFGLTNSELKALRGALGANNERAIFSPKYLSLIQASNKIQALKEALVVIGYPEARVEEFIDKGKAGLVLTYSITPGNLQAATALSIVGLPKGVAEPSHPTFPLSRSKAQRFKDEIIQRLSSAGYRLATVEIEQTSGFNALTYRVSAGEPTRVSRITVSGLQNIEEHVLRRQLKIAEGDRWDMMLIGMSRRRVSALGLFSRIDMRPKDGNLDAPEEELEITVVEKGLSSLRLGGGADSTFGAHIFGEGVDRSLFKDGKSISARADLYYDPTQSDFTKGAASLRFTDPDLLEHKWTEDLSYRKSTKTNQEFDLSRTSLSSSLLKTFDEGFSYTVGHSLQFDELSKVPTDVILSDLDSGNVLLSLLSASLSYDQRDDVINTRKGYLASLETRLSETAIGSDASFLAIDVGYLFVQPTPLFESRLSLADSVRYASEWAFGETEEIPISQRYYLGGRGSLRGFSENSLGPRGDLDHVIGGDSLFSNSTELRYAFTESLSSHVFLDIGNVFLRSFGDGELRYSSGLGFRFFSPVGPIGVDIGVPLDRKVGERAMHLHFSIGSSF